MSEAMIPPVERLRAELSRLRGEVERLRAALASTSPKERPIEFLGGCPNCGEEPETWSFMSEFDCACGASLVTMVSEDDDGRKHWWFDLAFEPNATTSGLVAQATVKDGET